MSRIAPLTAVLAFVLHVSSASLSLPISPALTIITVLLPLAAAANALFYLRSAAPYGVVATALQVAQGVLTAVLATLLFASAVPSAARACLLSTLWQRLFRARDAESILRIQDALDCCGFNTVRDRAWPFPADRVPAHQCAETYGRDAACARPWGAALQRNAGLGLGVVLLVGLLQMASWVPRRRGFVPMRVPGMVHYGAVAAADEEPERSRLLPAASATQDTLEGGDGVGGAGAGAGAGEQQQQQQQQQQGNPWASE
ncbi:hypothetical protein UVI_02035980 [Ustilaginoidea virens]|uniref:Tetraspanin Tsp3 n=1 Tax=Ustilaginoidea virens TaxID=1159556 RepID=A0A1B5KT10_USTVR|nr:hypothetical protein UVI_02035980 [Ustilaginoidea virens]